MTQLSGLKKLVQRYVSIFIDEGIFIVYFDKEGNRIPNAQINPLGEPTPGQGYYAHLRHVSEEPGVRTEWEIKGPDWEGTVTTRPQSPPSVLLISVERLQSSSEGDEFLARFA
jgi:hypothetical protein